MKMHDQDDALSDTPKALLSLFLIISTSYFDLSKKISSIAIELHSPFLQKTHRFLKIMKKKNPLTVSSHIYIPRTVTEDALEQF